LVAGVGHAVSVDYLYEVLWGDQPSHSAPSTLQSYVSHLRGLLGDDTIAHIDHAYRLNAEVEDIDALLFDCLLMRANESKDEPEACRRLCRDALHLWRGRPFGDLADTEAFKLEAYRLDELRLAAMELSVEAELVLGNHPLVVGELEAAVVENPYRERLWFLLIDALDGCGRRVEAMRACARLRQILGEVGLQASEELTALEKKILAP
ncbi:MAG: SARP family transcriptional regulator, partial [Acidimicrobiia bacterium]|nr:SARP family transcriptional regulator [Acidimicrobiia bacterium]